MRANTQAQQHSIYPTQDQITPFVSLYFASLSISLYLAPLFPLSIRLSPLSSPILSPSFPSSFLFLVLSITLLLSTLLLLSRFSFLAPSPFHSSLIRSYVILSYLSSFSSLSSPVFSLRFPRLSILPPLAFHPSPYPFYLLSFFLFLTLPPFHHLAVHPSPSTLPFTPFITFYLSPSSPPFLPSTSSPSTLPFTSLYPRLIFLLLPHPSSLPPFLLPLSSPTYFSSSSSPFLPSSLSPTPFIPYIFPFLFPTLPPLHPLAVRPSSHPVTSSSSR